MIIMNLSLSLSRLWVDKYIEGTFTSVGYTHHKVSKQSDGNMLRAATSTALRRAAVQSSSRR